MRMFGTGIAMVIFVVTIAVSLLGLYAAPALIQRSLFRPYWIQRRGEYWTAITSGFVHADVTHLLFNMMTFYFFAFPLERTIGSLRFAALYFIALLVSSVGTWRKHRDNPEYASLGASGAICAVLFAYIVYYPAHSLLILPIPFPIPAPLFAVLYLAYTWYSAKQARGNINHDAHLDGALTGLLFVAFTEPAAYSGLLRQLGA
jgi:membrane associated rhomboid family serine protease